MKKSKFLLIIILFINLSACGFTILNDQSNELRFNNIEINGDKRLSYILKNNLNLLSKQNAVNNYDILINISNTKTSKIKDASGKTTRFNLFLSGDLKLTNNNNKIIYNRLFYASNDYEVSKNHSDTIRNERNTIQNNIDSLSDQIAKYIQLINLN